MHLEEKKHSKYDFCNFALLALRSSYVDKLSISLFINAENNCQNITFFSLKDFFFVKMYPFDFIKSINIMEWLAHLPNK